MTQEDKELLLKDLSARLPYEVKVHITNDGFYDKREPYDTILTIQSSHLLKDLDRENGPDAIIIEPYLRPMSSMTEEELKMFRQLQVEADEAGTFEGDMLLYDWLNKNHFDYRLLIFQGLALEAPNGMYKTE